MEKTITLMSAKSQVSSLEILIRRYEKKAAKESTQTAISRYYGLVAMYAERASELRKFIEKTEKQILSSTK